MTNQEQQRIAELTRELKAIKTFMSALQDKKLLAQMARGLEDKLVELALLTGATS